MSLRLETAIFPESRILARVEKHAQGVEPKKVCGSWHERGLVADVVQLDYGNWIVGCRDQEQLSALKRYLATYHSRAYAIIEERPCNPMMISEAVVADGRYVRQTSCPGGFGIVQLHFEPTGTKRLLTLEYMEGGEIPAPVKVFAEGILNGLRRAAAEGLEFGRPIVGFSAKLLRAGYHIVDSSSYAFEKATKLAFADALTRTSLIPLPAD